jgi:hypothetical protein
MQGFRQTTWRRDQWQRASRSVHSAGFVPDGSFVPAPIELKNLEMGGNC